MKKCSHCGVTVKGNAVTFCPKCRKPFKKISAAKQPVRKKPRKPPRASNRKPAPPKKLTSNVKKAVPPHKFKRIRKRKPIELRKLWLAGISKIKDILKQKKEQQPDLEPVPVIYPENEHYDGYYDDKPTDDNRQDNDVPDPELIKRIVLISAGAIIFIVLAVIIMTLL